MSLLEQLEVIQINHRWKWNNPDSQFNMFDSKHGDDTFSKSYRINPKYNLSDLSTTYFENLKKGYCIGNTIIEEKGYCIGELKKEKEEIGRDSLYSILFSKAAVIEQKKIKQRENKTSDLLRLPEYAYQQQRIFELNLDYNQIALDGKTEELSGLIEKVNTGVDLGINCNNRVNRVFTPLTNLKKEYRKYLICRKGYSLLEIDFQSSHLFHLIKLIIDSKPSNALLDEVNRMKQISLTNGIYEHVMMQAMACGFDLTRPEAKSLFIESFLYGKYPKRKRSQWVHSLFPEVSKFIKEFGRSSLSIQLQRSEATLLNNRIFKRIALQIPDSIVYGVFDSVLVNEDPYDAVFDIMFEESQSFFGWEVPLTTKDLYYQAA